VRQGVSHHLFLLLLAPLFSRLVASLTVLCLAPCLAWGDDADETLGLFSAWQETSSTASRAPKPLSHTAENVTVVPHSEIEALNAHTLADVLTTIPGIQIQQNGPPGSNVSIYLQSAAFNHVLVLVDGIPINNLGDSFPDISLVPARIIERIEIVKGAASSAWGQALGGVINVITKMPDRERPIGGSASASIGGRTTTDNGAELSGTVGRFGYYLSGGYLGSDGFRANTEQLFSNNVYAKLLYDLPDHSQLLATIRYSRASRGDFTNVLDPLPANQYKEEQDNHHLYANLSYKRSLMEGVDLEVSGRYAFRSDDIYIKGLSDNSIWMDNEGREHVSGASTKLTWRSGWNLLVAGSDFEHDDFKTTDAFEHADLLNRVVDRWGIYLNDTVELGPVSVAVGSRFDRTETSGDQYSPSLGAVWRLTENTLVRAYTARGYSLPVITLENQPSEKVWTTQVGVESSALPYLWLKGTLFRNETWDMQVMDWSTGFAHLERHIALGAEAEARTTPVWNTSLGAGYTFTDTKRTVDDTQVHTIPTHTLQLALRYDDQTFRGMLTGRHIWWNSNGDPSVPWLWNGKYYGLIWDLHLGATLLKKEQTSLELFFSGHNLFNGSQYLDEVKPNTGRWFEGGMKVRF
jgi:vitamin B12 transporter